MKKSGRMEMCLACPKTPRLRPEVMNLELPFFTRRRRLKDVVAPEDATLIGTEIQTVANLRSQQLWAFGSFSERSNTCTVTVMRLLVSREVEIAGLRCGDRFNANTSSPPDFLQN
jgi:hypothetical protein